MTNRKKRHFFFFISFKFLTTAGLTEQNSSSLMYISVNFIECFMFFVLEFFIRKINSEKVSLLLKGAGDISVEEIDASEVNIVLFGAGNIIIGRLEAEYLKKETMGAGNVIIGKIKKKETVKSEKCDFVRQLIQMFKKKIKKI